IVPMLAVRHSFSEEFKPREVLYGIAPDNEDQGQGIARDRNAARSRASAQEVRGALLAAGRPADQGIVPDAGGGGDGGRRDQESTPDRSGFGLRLGRLRQQDHRSRRRGVKLSAARRAFKIFHELTGR